MKDTEIAKLIEKLKSAKPEEREKAKLELDKYLENQTKKIEKLAQLPPEIEKEYQKAEAGFLDLLETKAQNALEDPSKVKQFILDFYKNLWYDFGCVNRLDIFMDNWKLAIEKDYRLTSQEFPASLKKVLTELYEKHHDALDAALKEEMNSHSDYLSKLTVKQIADFKEFPGESSEFITQAIVSYQGEEKVKKLLEIYCVLTDKCGDAFFESEQSVLTTKLKLASRHVIDDLPAWISELKIESPSWPKIQKFLLEYLS